MALEFFLGDRHLKGLENKNFFRKCRAFLFLLIILAFTGLNVSGQEQKITILDGKKVAEIPFVRVNNLIVISVLVDNRLPLSFMLDSGVRTTILTDRFIGDLLGFNYVRTFTLQGAGEMQKVEALLATGTSVKLPGVQIEGHPMLVLQEDYLELGHQLGMQVHGIMGYELFRRFVVKIDYSHGVITLTEPESYKPEKGFRHYPLDVVDTKPYIVCEAKGIKSQEKEPVRLMVDTGASHALLLHQNEDQKNIELPEETIFGHLGRGLAGDVVGQIGRIYHFSLGNFSFGNVLTSFPVDSAYNLHDWKNRGGTIGGDILSRFTVVFNYSGKTISLKKNSDYKDPFIYSRTGLNIIAEGDNLKTFKVVSVREGSPAAGAGIEKGDLLVKINGRNAKSLTLSKIITLFRSRNGKRIRLIVNREGEEFKTSFRLRDII